MEWWCQMTIGITNNESKTVIYCAQSDKNKTKWRGTHNLFYISRIFSVSIHLTALQVLQGNEKIRLTEKGIDKANGKKETHICNLSYFLSFFLFFAVPAFAFVLNKSYFLHFPAFSSRLNKTWMPNIMSISCILFLFLIVSEAESGMRIANAKRAPRKFVK